MAACDLETLPLSCVRSWRLISSFNFALKLHYPVQLVCTCGKGFKRNINLIPSPPQLKNRSSSAPLDNRPGGGSIEPPLWAAGSCQGSTLGCDCWCWEGCCALSFGVHWHSLRQPRVHDLGSLDFQFICDVAIL